MPLNVGESRCPHGTLIRQPPSFLVLPGRTGPWTSAKPLTITPVTVPVLNTKPSPTRSRPHRTYVSIGNGKVRQPQQTTRFTHQNSYRQAVPNDPETSPQDSTLRPFVVPLALSRNGTLRIEQTSLVPYKPSIHNPVVSRSRGPER